MGSRRREEIAMVRRADGPVRKANPVTKRKSKAHTSLLREAYRGPALPRAAAADASRRCISLYRAHGQSAVSGIRATHVAGTSPPSIPTAGHTYVRLAAATASYK